ncbi:MAG: hypothetical protein ACI4XA_02790 [Oscillospiraceae bacterium]
MTLFIYALKSLKKEIAVNALTVLQLAAVIVITAVMVSSVMLRYRYYEPFSDILRSNGILCTFSPPANYDTETHMSTDKSIADEEMRNFIPDIEDIISCNYGPTWLVDENNVSTGADCTVLMYDNDVIERYKPEIESGRWLNTSSDADCIEGVISENDLGINVGDTIRIGCFALEMEDMYHEVHIVGKLSENTKIVGYWRGEPQRSDINMTSLYGTASFAVEQRAVLLLSSNYLSENTTVSQGIFGPALITFPDDYPQEKIEQARQQLVQYNCSSSYMLSEVNENSMTYIFEHIKNLLPIIIVLLIMVIVSSISSSALSTRRGIKSYAVFYITGLEWKKCAVINLIQAVLILLCSAVISVIALIVLSNSGAGIKLLINGGTVLSAAAIGVFYIITSMAMPIIMLSRTTPKQIFTR